MNVKEAAKLAGVSERTLRYYEEKGLIQPERHADNGYRDYSQAVIDRARLIHSYRALHFSLKQTQLLLGASRAERAAILKEQIETLEKRKRELEHRILLIRSVNMIGPESLKELNVDTFDAQMEQMQHSLDENTAAKEFSERFREKSRQDMERMQEGLLAALAGIANAPDADVLRSVDNLRRFIADNYYPCTDEMLMVYARSFGGDGMLAQLLDDTAGEGASKRLRQRMESLYASE